MNTSLTYKHVNSHQLPELEDALWEWINVMDIYSRAWRWSDVPWWYNERASISIFAGAVWRSGGIALEEYSTTKCWHEEHGPEEKYAGRLGKRSRLNLVLKLKKHGLRRLRLKLTQRLLKLNRERER